MTFRFSYQFFFLFLISFANGEEGKALVAFDDLLMLLEIPWDTPIRHYISLSSCFRSFFYFFACFFGLLSQCVQLFELFVYVRDIPNRTIAGVFGFFSFLFLTFSLHTLMLFVGWLLMMEEEDGGRRILGNELKEDARWSRRL